MKYSVIDNQSKSLLRQRYIDRFIDTTLDQYEDHITTLKQFDDGQCYIGYLWDFIKGNDKYQYERTMEQALLYLSEKKLVYVMWDIFTKDHVRVNRILSDNYPKDTIIAVDSTELCHTITAEWDEWEENGQYLPSDIYVFDDSMQWSVIFTHEGWDSWTKPELHEDEYIRICYIISE